MTIYLETTVFTLFSRHFHFLQYGVDASYYIKYFGLQPRDFPQKNGCFYFCALSSMPDNWSYKVAYVIFPKSSPTPGQAPYEE